MSAFTEFFLTLLHQFAGGPGDTENNLMRFGLAAVLWTVLFALAWSRHRQLNAPRERLLLWGFGLGMLREYFMLAHTAMQMMGFLNEDNAGIFSSEPLEHALAMAAVVMVAGSFLRFILDDRQLAKTYLRVGVGATLVAYGITFWWWPGFSAANPGVKFHQTWGAWLFHIAASVSIIVAIVRLQKRRGWLTRVVTVALAFFFLGEALQLINFATDKAYGYFLCPIGNSFHILAIPLLGYVYLKEQSLERQQAQTALQAYRDHLEDLVADRTAALSASNLRLQQEIVEREYAQQALGALSRRHELILNSAGEGILGIDVNGNHTFINKAAADMLGYAPDELIGQHSHTTWHHSRPDGTPYPDDECPLHTGYKSGSMRTGSDQYFWRKDGTAFPVRYMSTPIWRDGELAGAVVVFQDITERQRTQAELARQHGELAALAERQRIAADMHDGLAQTLSYMGYQVDEVVGQIESRQTETAMQACQTIRAAIDQASKEVRLSIASLQAAPMPHHSLQDFLAAQIETLAETCPVPLRFISHHNEPYVAASADMEQIRRIVQEAVLNAGRHAQAGSVVVTFGGNGQAHRITIEDNGRGFNPAQPNRDQQHHFGLDIMRARAARMDGRLDIESSPEEGTRVVLTWPHPGRSESHAEHTHSVSR